MEQDADLTQLRTKFKVVGEAVTRTGERIVSTAQDHGLELQDNRKTAGV